MGFGYYSILHYFVLRVLQNYGNFLCNLSFRFLNLIILLLNGFIIGSAVDLSEKQTKTGLV